MAAFGTGNQATSSPPAGGVAGFGSFNLPNFVGELFKLSPLETPFLSLVGGLTGGERAVAPQFTWQDTLHRAPALTHASRKAIEGADAAFSAQTRSERQNVCEIFQYGVELTYTKQAATGLLGTSGASPATGAESILGNQPVQNEMAWQLQVKLEQAALDCEISFLTGTFAYPNDGTARQTQGIIGAITDVAKDATVAADWDGVTATDPVGGRVLLNELMTALYDNGAPMGSLTLMTGAAEVNVIADAFQDGGNLQPRSMSAFGVNLQRVETNVGAVNIVINRHIPDGTVLILNLANMAPKFLPIPGKGHFFLEPLAKSGSYDRMQLYGEIGLKYGPQGWNAKATNFDGSSATA